MTTRTAETSPRMRARVAGFLYLGLGLFAPFSLLYVPSRLIVPGDAATTARNICGSRVIPGTQTGEQKHNLADGHLPSGFCPHHDAQ